MIISRKRFMEEINKAKQEVADKICNERYLDDRFSNVNRDISDLYHRVSDLEYRLGEKSRTNEESVRPMQ